MTSVRHRSGGLARRLLAISAAIALSWCVPIAPPGREGERPGQAPIAIVSEVYPDGASAARMRLQRGLANGVGMHAVLTAGERELVASTNVPFVYFAIPTEAGVESCYPATSDPDPGRTLTSLGRSVEAPLWRLGLAEFDQSGGCWSRGRPSPAGRTDQQAYDSWKEFYLGEKRLRPYLDLTAQQRGYKWISLCVYDFCPQYAFDLNSDAVLLERNNDELGSLGPGLAMLRGAARQHGGKEWGIDFSTWRYWSAGATVFDKTGRLISGWSPSTFERNMYAAYMAGAHLFLDEIVDYISGDGHLNPLGATVRNFADFSLRRHPDRGIPVVPMALLQEHTSGFEPKYGEFDQMPYKWYRQNAYTPGDQMFANVLDVAYPGHETWGTIVPGAPWKVLQPDGQIDVSATQAAYRRALAEGADPRRWEPMGSTRWGETLDVITDRSTLETLRHYEVVVIVTGGPVSLKLLDTLRQYLLRGGTVVINAKQVPAGAEDLTGLRLTTERRRASRVIWLGDGRVETERTYAYQVAVPAKAAVLARTLSGDPVVTQNSYGGGVVYVTTPDYMQDVEGCGLLMVGQSLLDQLHEQVTNVRVNGPPLQYLINTSASRTIVTLINTDVTGGAWRGTISFPAPPGRFVVRDWSNDGVEVSKVEAGNVVITPTVPPYGVRVLALEPGG